MNEESAFLIDMSCFVAQIVILFGFYFAALRRLFIPPTPSNILVLGIVLIGIPGLLLVFIWEWILHRRMKMTQLMTAWSVAFAFFVTEVVILMNYEKSMPLWMASAVALLCLSALGWLTVRSLVPFLRADERMRAVMRESDSDRIQQLASLGTQAIPHVQFMLADDYLPNRLDAIECLALMGHMGIPTLERAADDANDEVSVAATAALSETGGAA